MNAQLKPLPFVAKRPEYDNYFLGSEQDWIHSNDELLRKWWLSGDEIAGTPQELADFDLFARSQHDIQLAIRREFKETLRAYE